MLDAKVLREITNVNRVKLLKEAKQEVFSDIERAAACGRTTYYFRRDWCYLAERKFKFSLDEVKEIIDELTNLGYTLTEYNSNNFNISW